MSPQLGGVQMLGVLVVDGQGPFPYPIFYFELRCTGRRQAMFRKLVWTPRRRAGTIEMSWRTNIRSFNVAIAVGASAASRP